MEELKKAVRGVGDGEEVPGETERGGSAGTEGVGRAAAYQQTHARILLLSDENQAEGPKKDEEIARSLKVGRAAVERVRRRCVAAAAWRRVWNGLWDAGSNSIAVGRSWTVRGSSPRIQYGAGSDCAGLRRTAGRPVGR